MNLKKLFEKTYWTPADLSLATGVSLPTARRSMKVMRNELHDNGFINLDKSRVPTKYVIERLNIDIDWLAKNGSLEKELQ